MFILFIFLFIANCSRLVNVKTVYGAVGDCVTDDTTALQTAINNETGIFLPSGCYAISSTLIILSKHGFTMLGEGGGSTVAELSATSISWIGDANGTMMKVNSSHSIELGKFNLQGGSDVATRPGVGLFHTNINSLGSSHWNYFHDISINLITGGPVGVALLVGSSTNDDTSNTVYERMLLASNNYGLYQFGTQTIYHTYKECIFLNYFLYGAYIDDGDFQVQNSAFYSLFVPATAMFISAKAERVNIENNLLELLYNSSLNGVVFEEGTRKFSSVISKNRFLCDGANRFIDYQQQGDLDIHDNEFGGLGGGVIYIRNAEYVAASPRSLTMYNNRYIGNVTEDISGSWNYVGVTQLDMRSLTAISTLADSTASQAIFTKAFNLRAQTTYRLSGFLFIHRVAGTTSHQISISYDVTGTFLIVGIYYISNGPASFNGIDTGSMVQTQVLTPVAVTLTNSASVEINTIQISGLIRTDTAGTFNPKVSWSSAPGGTPSIQPNSYMIIEPISSSTNTELQ
jgi:hypothetical protein